MPKSRFAHFSFDDRNLLLALLNEGDKSYRTMAKILRCSPSTITNEVKKYRIYKDHSFGTSNRRCNYFYCDPGKSNQKGKLEKNHEYIRYYYPQGTSFNDLTQDNLNLMLNHINSVKRDSLNGKSPFELLSTTELQDMKKLGLYPISPNEVILSSKLFK